MPDCDILLWQSQITTWWCPLPTQMLQYMGKQKFQPDEYLIFQQTKETYRYLHIKGNFKGNSVINLNLKILLNTSQLIVLWNHLVTNDISLPAGMWRCADVEPFWCRNLAFLISGVENPDLWGGGESVLSDAGIPSPAIVRLSTIFHPLFIQVFKLGILNFRQYVTVCLFRRYSVSDTLNPTSSKFFKLPFFPNSYFQAQRFRKQMGRELAISLRRV